MPLKKITSLKLSDALQLKMFTIAAGEVVVMIVFIAYVHKILFTISDDIIRQLQPLDISGNDPFNNHLRKKNMSLSNWLKTFH